ncbi:DUF1127 domain-containing protein [Aliiroseovarius sp. KMU-50]|uniref:DUF1127 domain-containing protein n=1 Tax=Aliiroseovarius salicola TaxID=3009082 RepID=A0ABT4W078_9RHOB|nr:DUF1127 domain-containing protein [Aliiroseovarius sp. KMU-50]MDA5093385.1 DUF1127 domain-containing protein [Aliiroseovarius sp. KMU-50]
MTAITCTNTPTQKRAFSPFAWISYAFQIQRERKALAEMNDVRLNDIGVTPAQAHQESRKPIWDVPSHWVC